MSEFISILGWAFLPNLLTSTLQTLYYNLTIRASSPHPSPTSPAYALHRKRIYTLIILSYLLFTLYSADWSIRQQGSYYTLLGLPTTATDKEISSRFRKLTLLHHPDKLPSNAPAAVIQNAQEHFHALTTARDTLLSPVKRLAYDRFGPVISTHPSWKVLKTTPEHVTAGLQSILPMYVLSAVGMWVSTFLGLLDREGMFWRWVGLGVMMTVEVHAITRPWATGICAVPTLLNPYLSALAGLPGLAHLEGWRREPYLPFQALGVTHRALLAFFIALAKLGPVVRGGVDGGWDVGKGERALLVQLQKLEQVVGTNIAESARLLALEAVPFRMGGGQGETGDAEAEGDSQVRPPRQRDEGLGSLRVKIKEWFVTNTVRQDPEVKEAVQKYVERLTNAADGDAEMRQMVPRMFRDTGHDRLRRRA